jgi:choline dehydrogenase-like flavoprotein
VLIPFVNLRMIGKSYSVSNYQYQQLAIGVEAERAEEYIHGQITTLKSASLHPILQGMPVDLHTATFLLRNFHAGLGVVNLSLPDRRRDSNYLTIAPNGNDASRLVINYTPARTEGAVVKNAVRRVKRALWKLGCVVPPGMTHVRPMGASVHYAGTIRMTTDPQPYTCSKYCRSHDFDNLYIVDGATFPFLPAKNITFSLMANACRVADHEF